MFTAMFLEVNAIMCFDILNNLPIHKFNCL